MSLTDYATMDEILIVGSLIDAALEKGLTVSVNDGEETTVHQSSNRDEILGAMATTDHDWITFFEESSDMTGSIGKVMLVWGNGTDLISDVTWPSWRTEDEINALIEPAVKLADKLAEGA